MGDAEIDADAERVRMWLVERTYSDDEQNMVILTYATPDGERYFRKERALTSFSDVRDTTAAVDTDPENVGAVSDSATGSGTQPRPSGWPKRTTPTT